MGDEEAFDPGTLGANIRSFRKRQGLSIKELAAESGLTASLISQAERGKANFSLSSLRKICGVLDVPIFELFIDGGEADRRVVRRSQRVRLSLSDDRVQYELLSPLHAANQMEILMLTLKPGESNVEAPSPHPGEEHIVVLEGAVEIEVGGDTYWLGEGDSIYFKSTIPHRYDNTGDQPVRLLISTTPPSY